MTIDQQPSSTFHSSSLSLIDARDEFMIYQRSMRHSERTQEFYRETLRRFVNWCHSSDLNAISDIDSASLRRYCLTLVESGLADTTVHNNMRAVRAFFYFLEREELIQSNPMKRVKMPRVEKKILPAFTDDEIERLLQVCDGKD
ncbi:MAG: phage integrase N-terminal SAM-like domain-containing protein, partial [Myxococcales bacterium]|nr:phage integrase N-terminal SAM-like domain-containing protein [Myxococcales bacterium]